MDITIHASFLPHDDPEASLAFYRDTLGFEVRNDVEYGGMHWITVGPADQPGTSIVLYPPAATPGVTDDERRTIAEMMANRPTVRGPRLRLPRSCRQPDPNPGVALSRPGDRRRRHSSSE
jgi:catechol 2,3-dioxygenase-like lactoylglutathione lyase family enzyme